MDPGFVYDMDVQDYIEFLCGLGYDEKQMKSILRRSQWNCSQEPTDLNYPSFMAIFNNETVRKFSRVVMNVGVEEAVYHADLKLPTGMKITIEPSTLTFTGKYQKQNFVLSIETDKEAPGMCCLPMRNVVKAAVVVFFSGGSSSIWQWKLVKNGDGGRRIDFNLAVEAGWILF
ncbi:hypothetical protein Q3G72_011666 [Acer saccharum]|nr:hypothetical protein Q3G72_011666 [Acer saccharum]